MKKSQLIQSKLLDDKDLSQKLHLWRFKEKKIVFTNGCFDLFHQGHIHLLSQAADLGDILIIGLNSDQSVRKLKGPNRPVMHEQARSELLASMFFVDAVILFNEPTPIELIKLISPDFLVKGGDYALSEVVGGEWLINHGGEVKLIELLPDNSSTSIEKKILNQS